jgi:hypothetical protein
VIEVGLDSRAKGWIAMCEQTKPFNGRAADDIAFVFGGKANQRERAGGARQTPVRVGIMSLM